MYYEPQQIFYNYKTYELTCECQFVGFVVVENLLWLIVHVVDHAFFTAGEISKMRKLAQNGGDVVSTCLGLQFYTTATQVVL